MKRIPKFKFGNSDNGKFNSILNGVDCRSDRTQSINKIKQNINANTYNSFKEKYDMPTLLGKRARNELKTSTNYIKNIMLNENEKWNTYEGDYLSFINNVATKIYNKYYEEFCEQVDSGELIRAPKKLRSTPLDSLRRNINTEKEQYKKNILTNLLKYYDNIVLGTNNSTNINELIREYKDFTSSQPEISNRYERRPLKTISPVIKSNYLNAWDGGLPSYVYPITKEIQNKINEYEKQNVRSTDNGRNTRSIGDREYSFISIDTDLHNCFLENFFDPSRRSQEELSEYYGKMSLRYSDPRRYTPDYLFLRDQLRWYIMYRQTFIMDTLHDIHRSDKPSAVSPNRLFKPVFRVLVQEYRNEINDLINSLNENTTGINFDAKTNVFIRNPLEAKIYYNIKESSYQDQSLIFEIGTTDDQNIVDLLIEPIESVFQRFKSQQNIITHMKNILNDINIKFTGTSTLNYGLVSGIETIVAFNSGKPSAEVNDSLKFIYGLDALSKRFKYPLTLNLLDRLNSSVRSYRSTVITSLADDYDAGASTSGSFKNIRPTLINANLYFNEFFNFKSLTNPDFVFTHELLQYYLYDSGTQNTPSTQSNPNTNLFLTKFSTSNGEWTNNKRESKLPAVLNKLDNSINGSNQDIQAICMYKLLGDDSKASVLYGIFSGQISLTRIDNFTVNYISNDITSSMKACIKLPGALVISSAKDSFLDEDLQSNVEFIGQREWLPDWLMLQGVADFISVSTDIAKFRYRDSSSRFGKRIPKQKFIQTAVAKMRKKGTLGSFKRWCIKNRLISKSGKVTKKCIALAKKSPNLKIRRRAIFAQNIKAYKGAKKSSKFGKKTRKTRKTTKTTKTTKKVLKKKKIPKSLKKLAKKYRIRLTVKHGSKRIPKSESLLRKQIKQRMKK